jgi:hypothetical protein
MIAEGALGLTDEEIERCLGETIMPTKLVLLAKKWRDQDFLTHDDLYRWARDDGPDQLSLPEHVHGRDCKASDDWGDCDVAIHEAYLDHLQNST